MSKTKGPNDRELMFDLEELLDCAVDDCINYGRISSKLLPFLRFAGFDTEYLQREIEEIIRRRNN